MDKDSKEQYKHFLLQSNVDSSLIDLKSYSVSVDENGTKMNVVEASSKQKNEKNEN